MNERLSDDWLREGTALDCAAVLEAMFAFLDAEMAETHCDEVRLHLFACEDCLDEYDSFMMIRAVVRRSCATTAPAQLRDRLLAQVQRKPPIC